ncbi:hypothetical protein L228DRAFT_124118 [Xylona heveae TC161]|uniref:protein-histidine N-methyltransferase n=1 Tax=Xylona heveae (strain CBS 132557 / TC161) TaxID=1328760 RepID=A0A165HP05_XYLHT|nr:hypothetical protein L228DRAFT_124118 [Xylona heveae TC161]KZF23789.1 hypothetical protein L228DRAFT_124118 [Xylona heveae TC161]
MAFSFSFAGDDIEQELDNEIEQVVSPEIAQVFPTENANGNRQENALGNAAMAVPLEPNLLNLEELYQSLPDRILYSVLELRTAAGRTIKLPRRELFDVRVQLIAEDSHGQGADLTGLGNDDIKKNVYEGGYKSWECSEDLAKILRDEYEGEEGGVGTEELHCIELGCGTALPSLALFQMALSKSRANTRFTLADYNAEVLRLVTIPNLLLSWAVVTERLDASKPEDELDISPEMITAFFDDLKEKDISIRTISGSWGNEFLNLVSPEGNLGRVLVLASETIYSPESLVPFTKVLLDILSQSQRPRAYVAAKRMYFGVGGGVEEFKNVLAKMGGSAQEVELDVAGRGVARAVLDVSKS